MTSQLASNQFLNMQQERRGASTLMSGLQTALACLVLTAMTVTITSGQARPVNFQQVGQGQARAGGVLHFDYDWDSSTGNLANLGDCQVGENVAYPGGNPFVWNSPPYAANVRTPNPTVLWVAARNGRAQDNHSHPDFLRPYRADNFTATQDYRWRCTNINANAITNFANFVGIQIVRTVNNPAGNCWVYTITKAGATAQVRPMPNSGPCPNGAPGNQAQEAAASASQGGGSGISYSLVNSTTTLHEPVFAKFAVYNPLSEPVSFDLGLNQVANFEIEITGPDSKTVSTRLSSDGFGLAGDVTLAPGEAFNSNLLLNQWSDFAIVGDYRVKISLLGSVTSSSGVVLAAQPSQVLYLHIGPRDVQRLAQISADLADAAIHAPTMDERMEAAQTLSYVRDPVAVPQLARVLNQGTFVEQYAVEGLGRIGNSSSIVMLLSATAHADPDIRSLAVFTLGQIRQGASPAPAVKD
jgi:hypothetical protein